MTVTLTAAHSWTETTPSLHMVRTAARHLLTTISALDADDHRWYTAGALISSAAERLREAIGTPVAGPCVDAPPIVRERDLSTAAHRLLARDVRIENEQAAWQFLQLAGRATVEFS